MSKINDELSDRTDVSRQRRYQLRKKRDGRCPSCGRPASPSYVHCEKCRQARNVKAREAARVRLESRRRQKGAESYSFDLPQRIRKAGRRKKK